MEVLQNLLGYFFPRKCMICRRILNVLDETYICRLCYNHFKALEVKNQCNQWIGEESQENIVPQPFMNLSKQLLSEQLSSKELSAAQLSSEQLSLKGESVLELKEPLEADFNAQEYRKIPVISLFSYEAEYRKAILRWKYRGCRKYAKGFASLLVKERIVGHIEQAILVPIPLAPSRMRKRGYNQALDLAIEIGKLTDIPVVDCLKRIRDTKPQIYCKREERYANVQNSMTCVIKDTEKNDRKIKYMLLIDDIYTTGSTIKEAIRVIKRQYTFRDTFIYVIVVGKGAF